LKTLIDRTFCHVLDGVLSVGQHRQQLMVDVSVSKPVFRPAMQYAKAEGRFSFCRAANTRLLTSYQVMQHAIKLKFAANAGANYFVTLELSQQLQGFDYAILVTHTTRSLPR
jgi:hypothetical protein